MGKVILFGAGNYADEAYFYFTNDSPHEIVAFTVDRAYLTVKEKYGLPVIAFEDIQGTYPPVDHQMFVAIGYQNLNRFRAEKYFEAKAKNYELVSYISSRASNFGNVNIGDNCFVLEFATIQPCASVGNNVFIWSGNHIGHHATIGDHCYIAGNAVISGSTVVEHHCFIGVTATIGHEVRVGAESFIGGGCLITKNVEPQSVYVSPDTPKFRLDSSAFLRMTKMQ